MSSHCYTDVSVDDLKRYGIKQEYYSMISVSARAIGHPKEDSILCNVWT